MGDLGDGVGRQAVVHIAPHDGGGRRTPRRQMLAVIWAEIGAQEGEARSLDEVEQVVARVEEPD
jgi:hypothetical protein